MDIEIRMFRRRLLFILDRMKPESSREYNTGGSFGLADEGDLDSQMIVEGFGFQCQKTVTADTESPPIQLRSQDRGSSPSGLTVGRLR